MKFLVFSMLISFSIFSQISLISENLRECIIPTSNNTELIKEFYSNVYSGSLLSISKNSIKGIIPFRVKYLQTSKNNCEQIIASSLSQLGSDLINVFGESFQYEINQKLIPHTSLIDQLFLRAMVFPISDMSTLENDSKEVLKSLIDTELELYISKIQQLILQEENILEIMNSSTQYAQVIVGMKLSQGIISQYSAGVQQGINTSDLKNIDYLPSSSLPEVLRAKEMSEYIEERFNIISKKLKDKFISKLKQKRLGFVITELIPYVNYSEPEEEIGSVKENNEVYLDIDLTGNTAEMAPSSTEKLLTIGKFCDDHQISLTHNALINKKPFTKTRYLNPDRLKDKLIEEISGQIQISFDYYYNNNLEIPTIIENESNLNQRTSSNYQFVNSSFFVGIAN